MKGDERDETSSRVVEETTDLGDEPVGRLDACSHAPHLA